MSGDRPAIRAQLALEGSSRGPDSIRDILAYIDEAFGLFDPDDITDDQIDLVVFLSKLRDAIDPDSRSPLKLELGPRGVGRPASPASQRARLSSARVAAFLVDRWREKDKDLLAKQANARAAEIMGVSVKEIYAARNTAVAGYASAALKKVKAHK